MDMTTFLEMLKSEHDAWKGLVEQVSVERMTQPGVAGYLSVKDLMAHVTWFEREMVELINQRALAGSALWSLPADERNAAIYEQNRERPLSDIQAEAEQVYAQLLGAAESLSDEELNDPTRFRDMPADWIPWQLIAENSYTHYQQHIADLQAWLSK